MHLCALKPCSLSCRIWCILPYADNMTVSELVKNLYIVLPSAIGLSLVSNDGSPFFYSIVKNIC